MSSKLKKLGTLADVYQAEHLDGSITTIRLDKISPSADQPRQNRTMGIEELAASIKKDGLLSPIVVTREGEGYRIIAGERRYHALKFLNKTEAECRIISREERDYWRIAIIENLQRENLSPNEEADALLKLKNQEDYSDQELSNVLGKSRNYITEILGIATLPDNIKEECKCLGIDNKNLLIQAVQAYRKGMFENFSSAYKKGDIRTVRDARDFNSGRKPKENKQKTPEFQAKKESMENPSSSFMEEGSWSVRLDQKNILIECPTKEAAEEMQKWIQKKVDRLQSEKS